MPFYRSYGYRTPSSSIWQQPSTTLSLKSACAKYNVTEAQCQKANIRCQWRSMYGNSYAVVVEDDVRDLKAVLVAKAANEKQEKLKGKLGEKGYEQYLKKQADQKIRSEQKTEVEEIMTNMVKINAKNSSVPVQGVKVAQSNATKIWGISGNYLKYKMTKKETKGRCVLYDLEDVIQAALQGKQTNCRYNRDLSGLPKVLERLDKCDDDNARNQLAAFYRRKLDLFLPEVVELVAKEMIQTVRAEIKQAERKIANKKSNLGAFQVLSRGKKDISDDEENDSKVEYSDDDEEGKKRKAMPSPKTTVKRKKRKTVLHNGTIWGDNDEDFTPALEHHKTIKVTPITTRKTRSATRRAIADEK